MQSSVMGGGRGDDANVSERMNDERLLDLSGGTEQLDLFIREWAATAHDC